MANPYDLGIEINNKSNFKFQNDARQKFAFNYILSYWKDVSIYMTLPLFISVLLCAMFWTINSVNKNSSIISFAVLFILHTFAKNISLYYLKVWGIHK